MLAIIVMAPTARRAQACARCVKPATLFESGFHSFAPGRGITKGYLNLSREAIAVQVIGHEAAHSMGVDMVRDVAPTHYEAEQLGPGK